MSTRESSSALNTSLNTPLKKFFLGLMAFFYVGAGANHFLSPDLYVKMIPPFLPIPELLNYISGGAEIVFGLLLLLKTTRQLAAFGIILLLLAVYPANIYMAIKPELFGVPVWAAWLRLPLQLVLLAWAYNYARPLRTLLPGMSENKSV